MKMEKVANENSRGPEDVRSLDDWCRRFERKLAALTSPTYAAEQASRYKSHFHDMLQAHLDTGLSIAAAQKLVLGAVRSAEGPPDVAASRHYRGSTCHWRFFTERSKEFAEYSNLRTRKANEQQSVTRAEVEKLIDLLLKEFNIPLFSQSEQMSLHLEDLKYLLTTDYREVVGRLFNRNVLSELSKVSDNVIRPASLFLRNILAAGGTISELLHLDPLKAIFRPKELEIRAEPYTTGVGLSLRGFYCRTEIGDERRLIIFLNTAHHPGAVAATFAHELGHHMCGLRDRGRPIAAMEGTFYNHLKESDEVFADTLVSLSTYSRYVIRKIRLTQRPTARRIDFVRQVRRAYGLMSSSYRVDLLDAKLNKFQRLYYLTELVHFLRLRGALHSSFQI
jgi:hypothetical protein